MRLPLTLALTLATIAVARQLPLDLHSPKPASDPSFPQPGTPGLAMDLPSLPAMSLADALTIEKKASLWWDYARDVGSVVSLAGGAVWAWESGVCRF
jgi:hypothetical protein